MLKIKFTDFILFLDQIKNNSTMHRVSNHPVHILDENGNLSPSAFIPFCSFGGNMSAMGVKIDQFDVPVCNSFRAKILNDQLCYEVDPNLFIDKANVKENLKLGLDLVLDYNKDRQTRLDLISQENSEAMSIVQREQDKNGQAEIYLNSLGLFIKTGRLSLNILILRTSESQGAWRLQLGYCKRSQSYRSVQ